MDHDAEVQRAIGRYRSTWPELIAATLGGIVWILIGLTYQTSTSAWWVTSGFVLIVIAWFVPATIITPSGVRLVRRFKFIYWSEVTKVFQPGPGDPDAVIQLETGKRVRLYGVGRDRLPGIALLATRHVDTPNNDTEQIPD